MCERAKMKNGFVSCVCIFGLVSIILFIKRAARETCCSLTAFHHLGSIFHCCAALVAKNALMDFAAGGLAALFFLLLPDTCGTYIYLLDDLTILICR